MLVLVLVLVLMFECRTVQKRGTQATVSLTFEIVYLQQFTAFDDHKVLFTMMSLRLR